MKKLTKVISVLLAAVLVIAMATVTTFAAEAVSIAVITLPEKTVYYEGLDDYDTEIWCDPTGMVLEITFDDSTTEQLTVDENSYVDMTVYDYVIGENEAVVTFYGTDDYDVELTTTCTVTVEENPVVSVEITKMPTKTEYDIEKDVITRENFTLDMLYEEEPELMDEILDSMEMTFDELKVFYEENPDIYEMMLDIIFMENEEVLLVDTEGMEILVTFLDNTTQTVLVDVGFVEFNGEEYPIYIEQVESSVSVGENVMVLYVMGVEKEFTVNVTDNSVNNGNNNNNNNNSNTNTNTNTNTGKNPVIPNTDAGVSVAAAAIMAVASGFGMAIIPSKKKK